MKSYEKLIFFIVNSIAILLTTFTILKLEGLIDWPWWLVFIPIWDFVILCFIAIVTIIFTVDEIVNKLADIEKNTK